MKASAAIVSGALIAGVLDLTYAFILQWLRGVAPVRVLQAIASGLLGTPAFKGGWRTAALGFVLHFVIAAGAALTYYLASRRVEFLKTHAVLCGLLYGVAIYVFMERVVLPLSAAPVFKSSPAAVVTGLLVHAFCIGLPIALFVRRT